uniref:Uncharacterized protein n=1 Tax=Rhizophora mucronata TaxID=61149 RepID=A0A2P2P9J4_RHIMU
MQARLGYLVSTSYQKTNSFFIKVEKTTRIVNLTNSGENNISGPSHEPKS